MQVIDDTIDFGRFLKSRDEQKIRRASDWTDGVLKRINGDVGVAGDVLPWQKTHREVQLRPGEVSVWAGINGHGKSLLLGQVMLWLLPKNKCLIASMEMKPEATIERMLRQASGLHHPAVAYVRHWMHWSDGRLWIYDQLDSIQPDKILGMATYAGELLGVNHIVIDSLMKCGMKPDDYGAQKAFVDRLCWLAKDFNTHIHLVCHMRKREREGHIPDKFDIKGASEVSDLVDNVFIVHRNKDKESKVAAGQNVESVVPDASLIVAKQRHGEWEGKINLWFCQSSNQFVPKPNARTMPWPTPEEHYRMFSDGTDRVDGNGGKPDRYQAALQRQTASSSDQ